MTRMAREAVRRSGVSSAGESWLIDSSPEMANDSFDQAGGQGSQDHGQDDGRALPDPEDLEKAEQSDPGTGKKL
jgi:hypothetical protein